MAVDYKGILERLNRAAEDIQTQEKFDHQDDYLVIMSGLNDTSKKALLESRLTIRHFPFSIGRVSREGTFSSIKQGLEIADIQPYYLSQEHLSLVLQDNKIFLVDNNSKFGTIVNDTPMGGSTGGSDRIELKHDKNEIVMGGSSSPFKFQMEAKKADQEHAFDDNVRYGSHLIPVAALYIRLCHHVSNILTSEDLDPNERLSYSIDLITSLVEKLDNLDMLYFYSTRPESFSDVIIAHSVNVAIYVLKMAQSLSYPKESVIRLGVAAIFHDIGLFEIPKDIVYREKGFSKRI